MDGIGAKCGELIDEFLETGEIAKIKEKLAEISWDVDIRLGKLSWKYSSCFGVLISFMDTLHRLKLKVW